jgi:hypothetical protein
MMILVCVYVYLFEAASTLYCDFLIINYCRIVNVYKVLLSFQKND